MNSYDKHFFKKYVNEWNEIVDIAHQHIIIILSKIFINFVIYVSIPTFLYYSSDKLKSLIPFFGFEIYLILMFIKICYDILDWYNDVWIITKDWLVDLDWSLFNTTTQTLKYDNIEWIEIIQDWFIDTILWKWEIIANKIWWEWFVLVNAAKIYQISEKIDNASKDVLWEEIEDDEFWDEENNDFHHNNHNYNEEKLDKLIEVLSWVIEWQMWKKQKEFKEEELQEAIIEAKNQKWTIDLR